MNRLVPLFLATPLALAACSTGAEEESSDTTTTSETTTTSTTKAETPEPSPDTEPTSPPKAESIFTDPGNGYRCAGTDAYVLDPAYCTSENLGAGADYDNAYGPAAAINAQQETADWAAEQERLANTPIADGGTCPAYQCGYGTNDQGQANPSSGEIQTLDGCQQGYITDPELCASVAWVEDHEY